MYARTTRPATEKQVAFVNTLAERVHGADNAPEFVAAHFEEGTFEDSKATSALIDALREGRIVGAGLDVIEDEPLRTAEEAATPNLIATCHAAFCSVESKIEMRSTSARIALAAVTGQPLENVVNGAA